MAAPDYVPTDPTRRAGVYRSPPRRPDSWTASRPGDLPDGQPTGDRMGNQGPDQGYVYKLVPLFDDQLQLGGLDHQDVVAGCIGVALKRAAHFGRAPVVHDLRIAFTVFGFLDPAVPDELVEARRPWFAQVSHSHHYAERRRVADMVPLEVLAKSPAAVDLLYETDWRENLNL